MSAPVLQAPDLRGLFEAANEVMRLFRRLDGSRAGYANAQGGDAAAGGSRRLVVRHTANYVAAASLAEQRRLRGRLVDVGGGVGVFGAWLAGRLGWPWHLIDADPRIRETVTNGFPEATVHADVEDLPPERAGLVTAMEVIEHIPPRKQADFVRGLLRLAAPGGLVVLSTPDESGYLGGHSGYSPHIGVLRADTLERVVRDATGLPVQTWRLDGEPFQEGRLRRSLQPLSNRAWGHAQGLLPELTHHGSRAAAAVLGRARRPLPTRPALAENVHATPAAAGSGNGLLAAVAVPHRGS